MTALKSVTPSAAILVAVIASYAAAQERLYQAFEIAPATLTAPHADQVVYGATEGGATDGVPACCASSACSDCVGSASGEGCNCPSCAAKKADQPDPCATSHKGVFYANDFSYLDDPNYNGDCFGDCLKLMPVESCGGWGTVDVGGQFRLRYHHEVGMGQQAGATRFQDTENDLILSRLRLYTNWKMSDQVRFYLEGIYADVTANEAYIPRPIDDNYGDFLNMFFDLKLSDTTTVRVGRQELLYGAQRLVSPLDWGNTRRTFEGVKVMYNEDDWAIDGFYTGFVVVDPTELDRADYQQSFYGMYSVYQGLENATLDLYYLGYDNRHPGAITADFSLHTVGMRLFGSQGDWLYEFEGGPQFGRQSGLGLDQAAGFATAGVGRQLDMQWKPAIWFYYDYASGNSNGGDFNQFNQLFPLAHKYLGFIDATQRSNIESPNVLLTMQPHKKVNVLFWYYHFMANQDEDIVPSIGGTPAQSLSSKDWGDELDILVTYNFDPRSNVLFGYSHFWPGNKITPPGGAFDANFFYTQWELNF